MSFFFQVFSKYLTPALRIIKIGTFTMLGDTVYYQMHVYDATDTTPDISISSLFLLSMNFGSAFGGQNRKIKSPALEPPIPRIIGL